MQTTEHSTGTRRRGARSAADHTKEVAKEAAKEAIFEMELGAEEPSRDLSDLDGNTDPTAGESVAGFDLFEDVGKPRMEKGEVIRYIIKKNGERVGSKYHPYSWEKLSKEFGPGHFQVLARSESTNQFVKSQTQIVGAVSDEGGDDEVETKHSQGAQVPWQQPQLGFVELMNLLNGQTAAAKEEARAAAQSTSQTQVAMITMITEMMKSSQAQQQAMFMETSKMTATVAEKLAQSQEKMFERLNQRMDKLAELATKKPEGPGWLEIMKMQADSQNKGFEMFEKINRIAELKKEEQLELIEELKASAGENPKKSMTDSLIESVLPAITTALVANNQNAAQVAALQQGQVPRLPAQRPPQHRRAIHPPQRPQRAGPVQHQQRTPPPRTATPPQAEKKTTAQTSSPIIEDGGDRIGQVLMMPDVSNEVEVVVPGPVVESTTQVEERVADKVEVIETKATSWTQETLKEKCADILPVFLGTQMLDKTPPAVAAPKVVAWLQDHDIGLDDFVKWVGADDLLAFAREYDLPKEAHEWLNELYANLQSLAGNDARSQSGASS